MDSDTEQRYEELKLLSQAIDNAKKCGLELEFLEFFLIDYKNNGDILGAIWYADCEWDL